MPPSRTTRQIGFFKNFDELYWNVTGTGWTFPIDVAEARINLPDRVAFTRSALYTGPQGARGKDADIVEQRPGRIVFRTTKGLPYRNGLTVAAAWPKGVVAPPNPLQRLQATLADLRPGAPAAARAGRSLSSRCHRHRSLCRRRTAGEGARLTRACSCASRAGST
jgi:Predicted membrane protein (DUF2207) N-terminal domain